MYCASISFTCVSASAMIPCFSVGISMSSAANEIPPRVARLYPACISLSAKMTVSRSPQRRKLALMIFEISFFLSGLLIVANGRPAGRISDSSARPTVVSKRSRRSVCSPSAPVTVCLMRTWIFACSSTLRDSYARDTSSMSANSMPSPLALILSRVA